MEINGDIRNVVNDTMNTIRNTVIAPARVSPNSTRLLTLLSGAWENAPPASHPRDDCMPQKWG